MLAWRSLFRGLRQRQSAFRLIVAVHEQRAVHGQDVKFPPPVAHDRTIGLVHHLTRLKLVEPFAHLVKRPILRAQFMHAVI